MYVSHKTPVSLKVFMYFNISLPSIVLRASGPKATSAEAPRRAPERQPPKKQAMRKSHPPTGFEPAAPGSPEHRSTTRARENVTPHA